MRKTVTSLAIAASVFASVAAVPAQAQFPIQQIGVDGLGRPICSGPLGPGTCAEIMVWMQRGGMNQPMPAPQPFPQGGPQGGPFGPVGPAGIPTQIIPRDGQIVGMITQQCGGNPACIAGAWASVEVQRCAQGIGVPGGCFGPNGEIAKAIRVIGNDLRNGPGPNNDLVGCNGWLAKRIGRRC